MRFILRASLLRVVERHSSAPGPDVALNAAMVSHEVLGGVSQHDAWPATSIASPPKKA